MTADRTAADPINAAGLEIMADMFGEERARARNGGKDAAARRMNSLLTDFAYARVWGNPVLSRRERSLVTVALLAASGKETELALHLRAAITNGCSIEELHEVMIQLILYCGFPAALAGKRLLDHLDKT